MIDMISVRSCSAWLISQCGKLRSCTVLIDITFVMLSGQFIIFEFESDLRAIFIQNTKVCF